MGIGDKQTFVGQFFEEVGHRILGGDLSRDADGDICLWRTETTVEVKSSGDQSSYGFRLSLEQIESYERARIFPFNRAWYMLFAYRNHSQRSGKGKRVTEFSKHVTPLSINNYLANTVSWCLVVDLSIISRWKETRPVSTKSIIGHLGTKTVDLKCRDIHSFANGELSLGLKSLDLDPTKFGTLSGTIQTRVQPDLFSEYLVKFPMTAILPSAEISSVQRMLKRRGFRLQRRTR